MNRPGPISTPNPIHVQTSANRPKRKITGRGLVVACAALVMVTAGLLLRNGELLTLGACTLLLVIGCHLLARRNLHALELKVQLPPRFFANRRVPLQLELCKGRGLLAARNVGITIRFPHRVERSGHAVWTPAEGSSTLDERLSLPARAVANELEYELRSSFPLGLFEVRQSAVCSCPFMVYPPPITPPELQLDGRQSEHNPNAGTGVGDFFGEPRGIRPYQPGDKVTRIHPFASAHSISRGQGLQVCAFDPPGFHPDRCRVVFHSHAKAGEVLRLDRFERGLSLLAGTLAHFQNKQTRITLQADFADWRSRPCESRAHLAECLALLATTQRARQTKAEDLVEVLHKTSGKEQLVIVSDSPPDNWAKLVPVTQQQPILINIREARLKRRRMQLQPVSTR